MIPNEEANVQVCPQCGHTCNRDVTIDDHGMCRDCLAEWQFGEYDDEEEDDGTLAAR